MSTSSPEVTRSVSGGTLPSTRPAKKSAGRASEGIREGLTSTREELASIMDASAASVHKVDLRSQLKDRLCAAKGTVQAKIGQAKRHLNEGRETVHDKADEVTRQAKSLTNQARAQLPTPVAGRLNGLTRAVRQRPVPAVAIVLTMFVPLLLRRLLRRNK